MLSRSAIALAVVAIAASPLSLILAPKPVTGCSAGNPCDAKAKYEKAVIREKSLNDQVLKLNKIVVEGTPGGKPPRGKPSDWLQLHNKLISSRDYVSVQTAEDNLAYAKSEIQHAKEDIPDVEHDIQGLNRTIFALNRQIKELDKPGLTAEEAEILKGKKWELDQYKRARSRLEDNLSRLKGIIREGPATLAKCDRALQRAKQAEILGAWINYRSVHDQWEAADDELSAAKAAYDAGLKEKARIIGDANELLGVAQAQLQSVTNELQGKEQDEAYRSRLQSVIDSLVRKLSAIEAMLQPIDCFDDAKSMLDDMKRRRIGLQNYKIPVNKNSGNNPKTPPVKPENTGGGVFKLTKKEVGHVPGPDAQPYGTWSGSISETSFTVNYKSTSSYEFTVNLTANWTSPPATMNPGDTVELGVTASGSVSGKDRGQVGLSAGWSVLGNAQVLSSSSAFAGIASSGIEYPSGQGSIKFKVGTGGTITITSYRSGVSWGSGGNFTPCVYTYEFQK